MNQIDFIKFTDFIMDGYENYWELRYINKAGDVKQVFFKTRKELHDFIKTQPINNYHCYISTSPRTSMNGGNKDVKQSNLLFSDLDNPQAIDDVETIIKKLTDANLRPSLVVISGNGVHLYWKTSVMSIDERTRLQNAIFNYMSKNFAEYKPDKAVNDPARIMRIAGTMNIKNEPKPVKLYLEDYTIYDVGGISVSLKNYFNEENVSYKKEYSEDAELIGNDIPIGNIIDLSKLKKSGKEYHGAHPVHGSTGGNNFFVDVEKNKWCCFRHSTGGGSLLLIAIMKGIKKCEDCEKWVDKK